MHTLLSKLFLIPPIKNIKKLVKYMENVWENTRDNNKKNAIEIFLIKGKSFLEGDGMQQEKNWLGKG